MKALKIIISIIVILALCVGAYMIFFYHPGEVQAIMDTHEEDKVAFKEKDEEHEKKIEGLEKIIEDTDKEIEIIADNYETSEEERLEWKRKYEEGKEQEPIVATEDIETLEDFRIEYGKLNLRLKNCEIGVAKTENSLKISNELNLKLEEQEGNWIEKCVNLEKKSKGQTEEIERQENVIEKLHKIKVPTFVFGFGLYWDPLHPSRIGGAFTWGINLKRLVKYFK